MSKEEKLLAALQEMRTTYSQNAHAQEWADFITQRVWSKPDIGSDGEHTDSCECHNCRALMLNTYARAAKENW